MEHQSIVAAPTAEALPTILVARDALLGALATLKRDVVERRNTIPILSGVLFQPLNDTGDGVALIGTDLDIRVAIHLPAIFTDGCRFVAANCAALHDAVKACKSDEITLELAGGKLRLTGGGFASTLETLPAADFPDMVPGDFHSEFTLPGRDLAYDLARISPAISTEETRYYLNGIFAHTVCDRPAPPSDEEEALRAARDTLIDQLHRHDVASVQGEAEGQLSPDEAEELRRKMAACTDELKAMAAARTVPNTLRLAATDGHRLCVMSRPLPDGAATLPDAIIPRKVCALLAKLIGKPVAEPKSVAAAVSQGRNGKFNPDVRLAFSQTKVRARIGNAFVLAKLIDGSFPDYSRVIPTQNDRVLTLTGEELAGATKQASAVSDDRTRAVRLDIGGEETVFSCVSVDNGVGRATVAAQYQGNDGRPAPDMEIGFNAGYLATIGGIFGNVMVDVHLADAAAPTLFTSPAVPGFKAVLMPMRVDGKSSAPAPAAKPAEAPYDRLRRVYAAAFAAGDYDGVKRAIRDYHAAAPDANREVLACDCAQLRAAAAQRPADAGVHIAAATRAERRAAAINATEHGFVTTRARGGGHRSPAPFTRLGEAERAIAMLAGLPGYDPADTRNWLPVETSDQGLVYVATHELRDFGLPVLSRRDAKGDVTRKRNESNLIWRHNIKAVAPPKMSAGDMAVALMRSETERRAMAERMARLESMVADLVSRPAEPAPAVVEPAPAEPQPEPAIPPAPAPEPSVLGTIIADLAERAEVAEAAVERASRPRHGLVGLIGRLRARCAAAVQRANQAESERDEAKAASVRAVEERDAMAHRLAAAETELARLQPLAIAIKALAA